jgi:putative hydrolase of the HAD superfamily
VSNSFVGAREREQAAYGFEDLVEEIVYSHEVGFSKPDPRIYALICTRLNVPPEEMVFVDDSDVCVAGARDAGIHAVRYQSNAQAIAEIEKLLTSP